MKKEKSRIQWIVKVLIDGKNLKSKDIAKKVTEISKKEIRVQDVASMLSRLTDPRKCNLGYFITKTSEGNSYIYNVVEEIHELKENQAYGLTLKTGPDKYLLDEALAEYPSLGKYVDTPALKPQTGRPSKAKKSEKIPPKVKTPAPETISLDKKEDKENMIKEELEMVAEHLKKIADIKDLNININISVKFEGFGGN